MYYNTRKFSSSPRFNLKRPREQNTFLWNLNKFLIENTKITFYLTVILLDNKMWLVHFREPLKKFFGRNRGEYGKKNKNKEHEKK
jgi:hypothetical protein